MNMKPGLYWWVDETGMSGTGPVGQVSVFDDQSAIFRWIKDRNGAGVESFAVYNSIEDLCKVHGKAENFKLVPTLSIGSGWSMENWGCCGSVIEIDMSRSDSQGARMLIHAGKTVEEEVASFEMPQPAAGGFYR